MMVLFTVFVLGFLEISLPLPIVIVMGGAMEPAFVVIGISGSAGTRCPPRDAGAGTGAVHCRSARRRCR